MIPNNYFSIILFLIICSSCKLTEASIIGAYAGTGLSGMNDTLNVYANKTFALETVRDSSKKTITGSWSVNKKCLALDFNENGGELFGGCSSICYWNRFFNKKKLIRPMTCSAPTHHFTIYTKIK